MTFPGSYYVHSVTVEPFKGVGDRGDQFASPVKVACWVEEVTRLISPGTTEEVTAGTIGSFTSNTTVITDLSKAKLFPVASQVTLPSGRVARVLQINVFNSGTLALGLDHIEVHLN